MKNQIALALIILLINPTALPALDGDKAAYAGGTIARFNNATEQLQGQVDISSEHQLAFILDEDSQALKPLRIEYKSFGTSSSGRRLDVGWRLLPAQPFFLAPSDYCRCCPRAALTT